jgi:hypothetical protein
LWFFEVIKFPYEFCSKNFIFQSCNFEQDLSNAMLHTSIKVHLIHVFRFLFSRIKLWIWFMTFLLAITFNSKFQILQSVNPLLIFTFQDLYNNILGIQFIIYIFVPKIQNTLKFQLSKWFSL